MSYAVEVLPEARRHLARLSEKHLFAVLEFIYGALAENPRRVGGELHFDLKDLHGARRGEFRIVYQIDEERRVITIYRVEHRGDVYRTR